MKRSPAVVDTNVVVSGLLVRKAGSPPAVVLDGMLSAAFPFVLSQELLAEYLTVISRPRIRARHGLDDDAIVAVLEEIAFHAVLVEPRNAPPAPSRGDDHLWALLHAVPEALLVTGDALLLRKPPTGRRVVTPSDFVRGLSG